MVVKSIGGPKSFSKTIVPQKLYLFIFLPLLLILTPLSGCSFSLWSDDKFDGARNAEGLPWWEVAQGWDPETRKRFWFASQGSRMLPYDWFLHLEQVGSTTPFRDDANIEALRYIPAPADQRWNPDGLPIGFVKGKTDQKDVTWMGPTCAACHTSKLNYRGASMVIDGAPALGDFERLNRELVDALLATLESADKFQRFSKNVLGNSLSTETVNELKEQVQVHSMMMTMRIERDKGAHDYGFGRVDAVGAIFNQVASSNIAVPDNRTPADAPVSFPFLWGTPQSSVVQWNGFAPNGKAGLGALIRNAGEVLGVYGVVDVKNKSDEDFLESDTDWNEVKSKALALGYKSSVNLDSIGKIENWLHSLRSPQWPENLLPQIDQAKATAGASIYQDQCVGCHQLVPREDQGKQYQPHMIPVSVVGTDATMADNFLMATNPNTGRAWDSGKLEGSRLALIGGDKYQQTFDQRGAALLTQVMGSLFSQPFKATKATLQSHLATEQQPDFDKRSYKARPLTGIWATAPYFHNGSAPNLYEVILTETERSKVFYVGSREFDPVKVGYVSIKGSTQEPTKTDDRFAFDTQLKGNRNTGHNFGNGLSEEERWNLVEFLKTL